MSERHVGGRGLYDSVTAGGSLFQPDGPCAALDAALSSPSGIGVAVDDRARCWVGPTPTM